MRFQVRKIKKSGGDIEIRLSLTLSEEEASNSVRISDDPNVTVDIHRLSVDQDPEVRADQALTWLRILIFWVGIWNSRDKLGGFILKSVEAKRVSRNRKDKRVRSRRKTRRTKKSI